jgi:hypothetical protein
MVSRAHVPISLARSIFWFEDGELPEIATKLNSTKPGYEARWRDYADARKANRNSIDDVREGSGQGMESTALIVQIERAVMVVCVGARDSRSDMRVAVGGDWHRLIHIQRVVVD